MDEKMDEPVYLLCLPCQRNPNDCSMHWYVIEDRRNIQHPNQIEEDDSEVLYATKNNTDTIRSPRLPSLPHLIRTTSLVAINSCIYLLGGYDFLSDSDGRPKRLVQYNHVRFCDNHKPWQFGPPFPSHQTYLDVATSDNGSIAVIGRNSSNDICVFWLQSLTSEWEELPEPPKRLNVCFNSIKILALTDTYIYFTVNSRTKHAVYGLRFCLVKKRKWEVFDKMSFNGLWSQGVVFFDSYLVLYGTSTHISCKKPGSLRVYDLKNCKWNQISRAGSKYKKAFPECCDPFLCKPILFRVGHNKLAVVWQEIVFLGHLKHVFKVYCTKFIIHLTSNCNEPLVIPEVFSHGAYRVAGALLSSTARVTVGDGGEGTLEKGGTKKDLRSSINEQAPMRTAISKQAIDEESSDWVYLRTRRKE